MRKSGKRVLASSSFTDGCTMTSSPGTQLIGVVTRCLSPVWRESSTRRTSAVLRPVEAGYDSIRRIVFFGSMMNTERMVKAMPLESTLVVSWWSSLVPRSGAFPEKRRIPNSHIICVGNLPFLVPNDGKLQVTARDLVNVLNPAFMAVNSVRGETDELCAALGKLRLELCEGTEFGSTDGSVVFRVGEENHPFVTNKLYCHVSLEQCEQRI